LQEACENEALKELVCRLSHLPSVPGLYREIVTACNQPDASMEEVSRIIARDLGMSSLILKAVNCAFFGLARPMASVEEAAAYLGTETIKTLVLSLQTFSEFKAPPTGSFTVERLWAHSQRVAARAQQIARLENAERRLLDETFTAGMLHDIGKLVLAANLPTEYEQAAALARSGSLELHAAEKQVFGASHAEVGGYLLGLWGLPESIVEAVARHHTPSAATASAFSPLTAVHVAEVLEWEESLAQPRPGGPQLDAEYLAALRVSERLSVWRESSTAALEQLAA
jgi:putative nucleotidyltransferase with HDIG domain